MGPLMELNLCFMSKRNYKENRGILTATTLAKTADQIAAIPSSRGYGSGGCSAVQLACPVCIVKQGFSLCDCWLLCLHSHWHASLIFKNLLLGTGTPAPSAVDQ